VEVLFPVDFNVKDMPSGKYEKVVQHIDLWLERRDSRRAKESQVVAPDQHLNNDAEDIFASASPGA
jgi:hypothetical protein